MRTSEKIVDIFIESGLDFVFGVPGGGTMNIYDALYDRQDKVKAIVARHEQTASCMADMYGRLTGRPGVFIAQGAFAGSTGLFGIMEAHLASSPMLVLTDFSEHGVFSLHAPMACGTGEYGGFDLRNIMKATTKFTTVATTPTEAVIGTQLAIKHATTGRPGPAACIMHGPAISGDIDQDPYPRIYNTANYLRATIPQASVNDIQRAVDILIEAKKPVIISGNGIHVSRAYDKLEDFAKIMGASVATSYLGKSTIPENHPLAIGLIGSDGHEIANKTVSEADVLIVIGCRLRPDDTIHEVTQLINPQVQRIIQIDIDPKNTGWTFPIELGLCGDAKAILKQLNEEISRRLGVGSRIEYQSLKEKLTQAKEESSFFKDEAFYAEIEPILPESLIRVLRDATDNTAIVVGDAGNNRHWLLRYYQTRMSGTYFGTGGISGMSWSLPAVFVAKLLNPKRQCVAVAGDGGFSMQMHILSTAMEYNVAAVFVVMNNSGLGMIREGLGERSICTDFKDTDYAAIANAFGCLGLRVEKFSELRPAIDEALKSEKPSVIDVVISKDEKMFKKLYSPLASEALKRLGYPKR